MSATTAVDTRPADPVQDQGYIQSAYTATKGFIVKLPGAFGKPDTLQDIVKLIMNVALITFGKGQPAVLVQKCSEMDRQIDAIGTPRDIANLMKGERSKEYHEGRINSLLGNVCMIAANIGGVLLLLAEFFGTLVSETLVKLENVASAIGKVNVFGYRPLYFVTGSSLLGFTIKAATVGYFFLAVDAYEKIERDPTDMKSKLELCHYVAEVGIKVIYLAGFTNPVFVGCAGAATAIMALVAKTYVKPKPKADAQQKPQPS